MCLIGVEVKATYGGGKVALEIADTRTTPRKMFGRISG